MTIKYEHHEGSQTEKPLKIDTFSSPTAVYLRRNIQRITRVDEMSGEEVFLWSYEEAKLTLPEWTAYLAEDTAAKVEYMAMMNGIDFEEGED